MSEWGWFNLETWQKSVCTKICRWYYSEISYHSNTQKMVLVGLLSSISIYARILTNIFCGNLKKTNFFCELGSQVQEVYPPLPSSSFKFFFLLWVSRTTYHLLDKTLPHPTTWWWVILWPETAPVPPDLWPCGSRMTSIL